MFFRYYANYPYYSDAVWYLTQMRRWGQIPEAKADEWYQRHGEEGVSPGHLPAGREAARRAKARRSRRTSPGTRDGYRAPTKEFIDGIEYDGRKPNDYLAKLTIGLKGNQKVESGNVVGEVARWLVRSLDSRGSRGA